MMSTPLQTSATHDYLIGYCWDGLAVEGFGECAGRAGPARDGLLDLHKPERRALPVTKSSATPFLRPVQLGGMLYVLAGVVVPRRDATNREAFVAVASPVNLSDENRYDVLSQVIQTCEGHLDRALERFDTLHKTPLRKGESLLGGKQTSVGKVRGEAFKSTVGFGRFTLYEGDYPHLHSDCMEAMILTLEVSSRFESDVFLLAGSDSQENTVSETWIRELRNKQLTRLSNDRDAQRQLVALQNSARITEARISDLEERVIELTDAVSLLRRHLENSPAAMARIEHIHSDSGARAKQTRGRNDRSWAIQLIGRYTGWGSGRRVISNRTLARSAYVVAALFVIAVLFWLVLPASNDGSNVDEQVSRLADISKPKAPSSKSASRATSDSSWTANSSSTNTETPAVTLSPESQPTASTRRELSSEDCAKILKLIGEQLLKPEQSAETYEAGLNRVLCMFDDPSPGNDCKRYSSTINKAHEYIQNIDGPGADVAARFETYGKHCIREKFG